MVEIVSHVSVLADRRAAGAFSRVLLSILVGNVMSCSTACYRHGPSVCAERRVSGLAYGDSRYFRARMAPASNISLIQAHACGWCVKCASIHALQKHIHRLNVQSFMQCHVQAYSVSVFVLLMDHSNLDTAIYRMVGIRTWS